MKQLTFGVIGVSGYGRNHVLRLTELEKEGKVNFAYFAEIQTPRSKEMIESLTSAGKRHFENYLDLLNEHPDVVMIATPIHLHKEMALACFQRGIHVYLEKPPVVLLEDLDELLQVQKQVGVACQVGFQHASCNSVQQIIETIQSGDLGKPKQMIAVGKWARYNSYYNRSSWSGKLTMNGQPVLDGSVFNPLAHLLNISMYFGESIQSNPFIEAQAELYKGHSYIESEDTCCARFIAGDFKIGFYTSLCCRTQAQPYIRIFCEQGEVFWAYDTYYIHKYGHPMTGPYLTTMGDLIENMIDHLQSGANLFMPLEKSRSFVLAANAIFASSGKINSIPESYIQHQTTEKGESCTVLAMENFIDTAAQDTQLFSETGVPWSGKSSKLDMRQFKLDWKSIR